MKITRLFAAAFVAILLFASHAGANAAEPEEHFLLTPALLAKLKAAAPELKKLDKQERKDDDNEKNDPTAEEYARMIDKEPRARALLARHGFSTREFALTTYAMMHAGLYVGLEPSMNKKQAAEMLAKFTKEQRANIELVRKTDLSALNFNK